MLVTLGLRRVACVAGVEGDIGVGREGKGPYSLQHFLSLSPSPPLPFMCLPRTLLVGFKVQVPLMLVVFPAGKQDSWAGRHTRHTEQS